MIFMILIIIIILMILVIFIYLMPFLRFPNSCSDLGDRFGSILSFWRPILFGTDILHDFGGRKNDVGGRKNYFGGVEKITLGLEKMTLGLEKLTLGIITLDGLLGPRAQGQGSGPEGLEPRPRAQSLGLTPPTR